MGKLILAYKIIISIVSISLFFTNLDIYLYLSDRLTYRPIFLVMIFAIGSLPLLLSYQVRFHRYLLGWSVLFILISSLSIVGFTDWSKSHEIAFQELRLRILSVLFLLLMFVVFSSHALVQTWARRSILIAVFIATINNIYDFFHPFVFSFLNTGRPAGFYINPNQAGAALVLGMIFSIGILKPKYRIPFVLIVGLGLLLTLSRGAILAWFVILFILVKMSVLSSKNLIYYLVLFAILFWGIEFYHSNLLSNIVSINPFYEHTIGYRAYWFSDLSKVESSDALRLRVLKLGWTLFSEHPLLGNGLGSTLDWDESVSTHNMYLYLMVDHGIIGALMFPLLVFSVTHGARGEAKQVGLMFAVFILIWGLFSHNVLSERYVLMMFSLMAAMTITSRQEQSSFNQQEL